MFCYISRGLCCVWCLECVDINFVYVCVFSMGAVCCALWYLSMTGLCFMINLNLCAFLEKAIPAHKVFLASKNSIFYTTFKCSLSAKKTNCCALYRAKIISITSAVSIHIYVITFISTTTTSVVFFFGKGNDNWLVFCFMIAIDLVCNPLFLSQSIYVFLTCCLYLRCMINLLKVLEHDIQTFEKKSIGTETKQPNNIYQLWCWKSNINLSTQ